MKKTIETSMVIESSKEKIWGVLTDFKSYPEWNPFVKEISGDQYAGGKLRIQVQPPTQSKMNFTPDVLVFEKQKEFRWKGKLLIKGLFDGEHYFILNPINEQTTLFVHGENFSGLLIPLFTKVFGNTKIGFELMNEALKQRCEKT